MRCEMLCPPTSSDGADYVGRSPKPFFAIPESFGSVKAKEGEM